MNFSCVVSVVLLFKYSQYCASKSFHAVRAHFHWGGLLKFPWFLSYVWKSTCSVVCFTTVLRLDLGMSVPPSTQSFVALLTVLF